MAELTCNSATNEGFRDGVAVEYNAVEKYGSTPNLYLDRCMPSEWPWNMHSRETGCYRHTSRQDCTSPDNKPKGVTCTWNEPCYYDLDGCYDPLKIPADVCSNVFPNSGVPLVHSVRGACHHNFLWLDKGVKLRCHQGKDTSIPWQPSFFPNTRGRE